MDTSTTLSPNAHNLNKEMEDNYKLALKQFINKNFIASFKLSRVLFLSSFNEYKQGTISLNLLIKIINLYLVVIGVCLKEHHLDQILTNSARNSISSNEVNNLLGSVWSTSEIPTEVIYNLHLLFISNQDLIKNKDSYLYDLNKTILNINPQDKYGEKLLNLVKFEIYPNFNEFEKSERLIKDNEQELQKLHQIKQIKESNAEKLKQKQLDDAKFAQDLKLKKDQEARKLAHEQNLKYKSIKEITNSYNNNQREVSSNKDLSKKENLKEKLMYIVNITKKYLQQNSIVLVVILILLFGSSKYLKGVNIKEKLVDTIKMAFKFTYI
ncbi:hypothetical protein KGF54_001793 [Candida jiufengensis]|uniref:uncharacterized protein n=1 Tax=Candida jiufengensis TaxID=497108 RepID=UPI00222500D0|nr:uncharacterized protein KGF54_001793 [Candida jiufengensis]KAI5955232.1 hypothetical protein KGF54_001793 [Candida jiufengensis]